MVKYHAECVRTHHVKGEIVASALDDAACRGGWQGGVGGVVGYVHIFYSCIGEYLQWEVVLYRGHWRTEHALVYIIVLVALSYEELLLHPVGKLQETWINEILDVLDIFFGDTHSA